MKPAHFYVASFKIQSYPARWTM